MVQQYSRFDNLDAGRPVTTSGGGGRGGGTRLRMGVWAHGAMVRRPPPTPPHAVCVAALLLARGFSVPAAGESTGRTSPASAAQSRWDAPASSSASFAAAAAMSAYSKACGGRAAFSYHEDLGQLVAFRGGSAVLADGARGAAGATKQQQPQIGAGAAKHYTSHSKFCFAALLLAHMSIWHTPENPRGCPL